MTLEQLRIFVAVAEREHLTQAAASLHLTPSAVSSAIHTLERRYGAVLFNRVGRHIELSDIGRAFLDEARATLSRAAAAELALSELGGLKRGRLSIQASQTIASYWLPPILVRFHDTYPDVDVQLTIGNTETVAKAVLDGLAEVGFVEGDFDQPALATRTVEEDRLVVVVAPGHPWAGGRAISPAQLTRVPWIMRESGSGTRSAFETALRAKGIDTARIDIALELPSNEAVRAAAESGGFAAVMSEVVAAPYLESGRLIQARLRLPPRFFRMLWHKERYRTKAAQALQTLIPTPSRRT